MAKKPYNPIIGESFHCSFDIPQSTAECTSTDAGTTRNSADLTERVHYVAEQVSHHPPSKLLSMYFNRKCLAGRGKLSDDRVPF